jgi:hypothetical protein
LAILIRGRTICPICGLVITEGQPAILFGPFAPNEADPLRLFDDAAVHEACLRDHPLGAEAIRRWDRVRTSSGTPVCPVCGKPVTDPNDFIAIPRLTEDPLDPVFEFNSMALHRSHLARWPGRAKLAEELRRRISEGTLHGYAYSWLLEQVDLLGET